MPGPLAGELEQQQVLHAQQLERLKVDMEAETRNTRLNMSKLQEVWLRIMRDLKTQELKQQVDVLARCHEEDVKRRDTTLQMLSQDLEESEEQHLVAFQAHSRNVGQLLKTQEVRLAAWEEEFQRQVAGFKEEFGREQEQLSERREREKREWNAIIQQVNAGEKNREQADVAELQSQIEMIRNQNIEEELLMKANLEKRMEEWKSKCAEKLQFYQSQTEGNTTEYRVLLAQDASLSKDVERKLRQVERMQVSMQQWRGRIALNKQDNEERNAALRSQKDQLAKHYHDIKAKMKQSRAEEKKRLAQLTQDARTCREKLKANIAVAERALKTAEMCGKFETEREKVVPFYAARDQLEELEERGDEYGLDDDLKKEMRRELLDVGVDEWTYLDNFFKRYNKVMLDCVAIEHEGKRLTKESNQLRSVLKQFLDGVSVNNEVLSGPNPLFIVNGKANFNHVPAKRIGEPKVVIEAAHHVVSAAPR